MQWLPCWFLIHDIVEHRLKNITILTFMWFSGKGGHLCLRMWISCIDYDLCMCFISISMASHLVHFFPSNALHSVILTWHEIQDQISSAILAVLILVWQSYNYIPPPTFSAHPRHVLFHPLSSVLPVPLWKDSFMSWSLLYILQVTTVQLKIFTGFWTNISPNPPILALLKYFAESKISPMQ